MKISDIAPNGKIALSKIRDYTKNCGVLSGNIKMPMSQEFVDAIVALPNTAPKITMSRELITRTVRIISEGYLYEGYGYSSTKTREKKSATDTSNDGWIAPINPVRLPDGKEIHIGRVQGTFKEKKGSKFFFKKSEKAPVNAITSNEIMSFKGGIGGWNRYLRNTVFRAAGMHDFDMVNSHISIVLELVKEMGDVELPSFVDYFNNSNEMRQLVIEKYNITGEDTNDIAKSFFISVLNGGGVGGWMNENQVHGVRPEYTNETPTKIKRIDDYISDARKFSVALRGRNPELYNHFQSIRPGYPIDSKFVAFALQTIETIICCEVKKFAIAKKLIRAKEYLVDMKDGFATYVPEDRVDTTVGLLNDFCRSAMCTEFVVWKHKVPTEFYDIDVQLLRPIETQNDTATVGSVDFSIETDSISESIRPAGNTKSASDIMRTEPSYGYITWKEEFEKTHMMIGGNVYLDTTYEYTIPNEETGLTQANKIRVFSYRALKEICMQYAGQVVKFFIKDFEGKDVLKEVEMMTLWLNDTNRRQYNRLVNLPPSATFDPKSYNIWKNDEYHDNWNLPNEYNKDSEEVKFIINHFYELAGKNDGNFLINQIGHIVQHPENKTKIFPHLSGNYGCGKSTVNNFMVCLLGKQNCFYTSNPQQLFGRFNKSLMDCRFIFIDELESDSMKDSMIMSNFKAALTEPTIQIEGKGKDTITVDSFNQLFGAGNAAIVFRNMTEDERRVYPIFVKPHLIGNREYFDKFYSYISNYDIMRAVYKIFKTMSLTPMPREIMNEAKKVLLTVSEPLYGKFLRWAVEGDRLDFTKPVPNYELDNMLKTYAEENGFEKSPPRWDVLRVEMMGKLKDPSHVVLNDKLIKYKSKTAKSGWSSSRTTSFSSEFIAKYKPSAEHFVDDDMDIDTETDTESLNREQKNNLLFLRESRKRSRDAVKMASDAAHNVEVALHAIKEKSGTLVNFVSNKKLCN
jgi:hypothetical protein